MAITKIEKEAVVKQFRRSDLDTGSSEVQIALMTVRINQLTEHFKVHKQDQHSQRGLVKLINKRRRLLDYLKETEVSRYEDVIKKLEIRK